MMMIINCILYITQIHLIPFIFSVAFLVCCIVAFFCRLIIKCILIITQIHFVFFLLHWNANSNLRNSFQCGFLNKIDEAFTFKYKTDTYLGISNIILTKSFRSMPTDMLHCWFRFCQFSYFLVLMAWKGDYNYSDELLGHIVATRVGFKTRVFFMLAQTFIITKQNIIIFYLFPG